MPKKKTHPNRASSQNSDEKAEPPRRKCGTMQVHEWLLEDCPTFRECQVQLERDTRDMLRRAAVKRSRPFQISVVVHIVYNTPEQNISKSQVTSQIKVLNRDFRAKNPDRSKTPIPWKGLVADAMIEFALADRAPDGSPSEGITRTQTEVEEFLDDDGVKLSTRGGIDPWPTDKYLNIWVCPLSGGLLGYAQFPGGPEASDGVVITHSAFGTSGTAKPPFHKGRTTTHEIGHYLNLRHIWGDTVDCGGGDSVADTPNAETPNYGKPDFPKISCQNGPHGDMFMNYMDYVDDEAMFMFTTGQVARMHATLAGLRKGLVT
jgi:hypothetical protein